MKKVLISTAALALVILVTSACGNGANTAAPSGTTAVPARTSPPTTTAPSTSAPRESLPTGTAPPQPAGPKGDYIEKADAICTDLTKKSAALAIDLNSTKTADITKQADAIDQIATLGEDAVGQLKALTPPAGSLRPRSLFSGIR